MCESCHLGCSVSQQVLEPEFFGWTDPGIGFRLDLNWAEIMVQKSSNLWEKSAKLAKITQRTLEQEVSLASLVREVDVQLNHPGLNPHGCRFGFLLFKKNHCRGFPIQQSFQKNLEQVLKQQFPG